MSEISEAVRDAYRKGIDDELIEPIVRIDSDGRPLGRIEEGDSVIFYNIRGEREIELTRSLTEDGFHEFPVETGLGLRFSTMIEYQKGLNVDVAFPPRGSITSTLSEVLASRGLRQVKITEAEKAIHVGYFLNGKRGELLPGEERVVVPTREDVALFDEAPEMSIAGIVESVQSAIADERNDVIIVNFPNVDVVGHIENRKAILDAVEAVDRSAGIVVSDALREEMTVVITADHGTVEKWLYPDGAVDTGHTDSPVPFIVVTEKENIELKSGGALTDIAPTVLHLLGIEKPSEMTGTSLVASQLRERNRRILLMILDGWGEAQPGKGNLIAEAKTPVMDMLSEKYPQAILEASGTAVGLPAGTVGNSEAGHLHIGAGRIIDSDRVEIGKAISDGSFFSKDALIGPMEKAKETGKALHLLGIVSFFSSHGSVDYLFSLMELARRRGLQKVYIHAMLGRRGERPESGAIYVEKIEKKCEELGVGVLVSVIGRYWSMDREENWDRIEKTYRMLVYGEGRHVNV